MSTFKKIALSGYVTNEHISYSDQGSAFTQKSNTEYLEENASSKGMGQMSFMAMEQEYDTEIVVLLGYAGSVQFYVHPDSDLVENVELLECDHIISDNFHSEKMEEYLDEAWKDYLNNDIRDAIKNILRNREVIQHDDQSEKINDFINEYDFRGIFDESDIFLEEYGTTFYYQENNLEKLCDTFEQDVLPDLLAANA